MGFTPSVFGRRLADVATPWGGAVPVAQRRHGALELIRRSPPSVSLGHQNVYGTSDSRVQLVSDGLVLA